jgi:hypothetical protein
MPDGGATDRAGRRDRVTREAPIPAKDRYSNSFVRFRDERLADDDVFDRAIPPA